MNALMRAIIGTDETQHKSLRCSSDGALMVSSDTALIAQTEIVPTVTVNNVAYTSGDNVGGKLTLANAVRVSGGVSELKSVAFIDAANQKPVLEIIIFNADPTASTITNNAAFVLHANDIAKVIARIPVATGDWVSIDTKGFANITPSRILKAATGTTLYAALITTSTPTYVNATDLTARFGFEYH